MTDDAYAQFERCIPENQREDVLTMIAEAASEYGEHDCITILDRDRLDAINVRAHGIIQFSGEEYTFIVQDGNWAGTVLEDWNGGKEFEHSPRTKWALQPRADIVGDAILAGRGQFLVTKWDAFLARPEVADIPRNYSYDRMMQPGMLVERHWKDRAANYGFVLVSQEEADATRNRLLELVNG